MMLRFAQTWIPVSEIQLEWDLQLGVAVGMVDPVGIPCFTLYSVLGSGAHSDPAVLELTAVRMVGFGPATMAWFEGVTFGGINSAIRGLLLNNKRPRGGSELVDISHDFGPTAFKGFRGQLMWAAQAAMVS